jgi:hypothetical protein
MISRFAGLPPLNGISETHPIIGHRVLHMENAAIVQIRLLEESDPPSIAAAFKIMGWNKSETQYRHYLQEQVAGTRTCFVAIVDGQFAGM